MTCLVMVGGILFQILWDSSASIVRSVIPFFYEKKRMIYIDNYSLEQALIGNTDNLMLLFMSIPLVMTLIIAMWLIKLCESHWEEIVKEFKVWEFGIKLPKFITMYMSDDTKRKLSSNIHGFFEEKKATNIPQPDIQIGVNVKTEDMVVLPGKDRTLNNLIIGAIGTGKTSALILPMINQDLHYMTYMINNFGELYAKEDFHSEQIKGSLLNGISIIEPSKDLCDKAYELVLAHGVPKEAVYYVDPTNPDTPSLNLFNGPVHKVSEMFTMVIEGIGENTDFFFQQSQRNHLKMHIYLLMLHEPGRRVGFEELIDMYNNSQLVYTMHQKLKKTIPDHIDDIKEKDLRNHWLIVRGVDEWFDETYTPEKVGFGANQKIEKIEKGKYRGQPKIIDTKSEHVVGLRNILNDIASNILMRRALFGKSDFDFDKHLEYGGILLVNTAKGELSALSEVLGKFTLLSLQNAVFRRKPNVSSYHSIYVDEFPDYINKDFASFPAQSRKYKAIITVVAQTVSQLSLKYKDDFMNTLIATLRNKFVYGDAGQKDAEMFSAIFGEEVRFEEGESDQEVSPLMESPVRRTGLSYGKLLSPILNPNDIIYQDAFVCAVKIVQNNKPIPAQQVLANFVPRDEFKNATISADEEKAKQWLEIRENNLTQSTVNEGLDGLVAPSLEEEADMVSHTPSFTMEENILMEKQSTGESFILDQSLFQKNVHDKTLENELDDNEESNQTNEPDQSEMDSMLPDINWEQIEPDSNLEELSISKEENHSQLIDNRNECLFEPKVLKELEQDIDEKIEEARKLGDTADLFTQNSFLSVFINDKNNKLVKDQLIISPDEQIEEFNFPTFSDSRSNTDKDTMEHTNEEDVNTSAIPKANQEDSNNQDKEETLSNDIDRQGIEDVSNDSIDFLEALAPIAFDFDMDTESVNNSTNNRKNDSAVGITQEATTSNRFSQVDLNDHKNIFKELGKFDK